MNTSSRPDSEGVHHVSRASELLVGLRAAAADEDVPEHLRVGLVAAASRLIDALNRRPPLEPTPRDLDDSQLLLAIGAAREVELTAREHTSVLIREARHRALVQRQGESDED